MNARKDPKTTWALLTWIRSYMNGQENVFSIKMKKFGAKMVFID